MNNNYFNFNTDIKPPIKIKLEVDPLPDFDKLSNKLVNNTKIADKINKKNNDYYNLYKDFNENTNNLDIVHKLEKAPFLFGTNTPRIILKGIQMKNNAENLHVKMLTMLN